MSDEKREVKSEKENKHNHFHVPNYVAHADQSVFNEIWYERGKQNDKWGEQNHDPFIWMNILTEEVGEACQAALQAKFGGKKTYHDYREELVQIAAVAEAAIESLDRNELELHSGKSSNNNNK